MLAAPFEERLDAALFHRAITLMWPEIARWPINPKRWPQSGHQMTTLSPSSAIPTV